jgi:hypothetical protein
MIINAARSADLGLGIEGAVIQASDSSVVIPNVTLPVSEIPSTLNAAAIGGQLQRKSFVIADIRSRNNQAGALESPISFFGKGLWEIDVSMTWGFDYASIAIAGTPWGLVWGNLIFNFAAITIFPQIGVQQWTRTFRALFPDDKWYLALLYGTTTVAQNGSVSIGMLANKLL